MFSAATKSAHTSNGKANYIEDVFSTYLYTGNGTAGTNITNGIDLAGKGGLVWTKPRSVAYNHCLIDTVRGSSVFLSSNKTDPNFSDSSEITGFLSNGYTLGDNSGSSLTNTSPYTYASWTFRKQAKFFDVVTWTGDGTVPRTIYHNLQSVPGFIAVKCTSNGSTNWLCFARYSDGSSTKLRLNGTAVDYNTVCSQGDIVGVDYTDRFRVDYGSKIGRAHV